MKYDDRPLWRDMVEVRDGLPVFCWVVLFIVTLLFSWITPIGELNSKIFEKF